MRTLKRRKVSHAATQRPVNPASPRGWSGEVPKPLEEQRQMAGSPILPTSPLRPIGPRRTGKGRGREGGRAQVQQGLPCAKVSTPA